MNEVEEYYLQHHGVKGMKWGVRKKRETGSRIKGKTVSAEKQARRDGKAAKHETRAKKYGDAADALEKELGSTKGFISRKTLENKIKDLRKVQMSALDDANRKREGRLSKGERNAVIVAGVIAAYAGYKLADGGNLTAANQRIKQMLNGEKGSPWKVNTDLASKDMDVDDIASKVMSRINPNYGQPGTTNNCRRCTIAYEMSRRGYDVSATKSISGTGQNVAGMAKALGTDVKGGMTGVKLKARLEKRAFDKTGNFAEMSDLTKQVVLGNGIGEQRIWNKSGGKILPTDVLSSLAEQPDGARGELTMKWAMGGGHSMAYEIVKGKPVIFDNQRGKVYKTAEDLKDVVDRFSDAGFTRLDNKELSDAFIQRWVKNN